MNELSNDASQQVKGFIYQFLIALEKCFEMREGQFVYIECHGDVSLKGTGDTSQIEVKFYQKALTTFDLNVWNTIANWSNPDFPIDNYQSLVLLTTQNIGKRSPWVTWNSSDFEKREKAIKALRAQFSTLKSPSKKLQKAMDVIFAPSNKERLNIIIEKMALDTQNEDDKDLMDKLCDTYAKGLHGSRRKHYIEAMLGHIINPHITKGTWVISFDDFSRECEELTQTLLENTVKFPAKRKLSDIDVAVDKYQSSNFVTKIQDIKYDREIPNAVKNYVHAMTIINEEFAKSTTIMSSLEQYEDDLEIVYEGKYRTACMDIHSDEIIKASQKLYNDLTSNRISNTFHTFNEVPMYFQYGFLQIMADEKEDMVWLVKSQEDE
ncbi:MAG: hypothetical protein IJQ84_01320 [Paludibacteraceae bacterium]|nr:hypothetical protein [Paludibacteraceae bacterium]